MATATDDLARELDGDHALTLYRRMVEIREFENRVMHLFTRNLVRGTTHLCQGQEAVAVGVCDVLRPGDTMTCTYRGHGALLAIGTPMDRAMGEILGRESGACAGKGGSMHIADASVGALGSFAIVGANLPVTVGAALSAKLQRTRGVSVAFFGDGSTNIGAFHEALNLAAVWKLPAIFVCENNLYGEYSPIAATTAVERIADRAGAYAMPGERVDGNDVLAVRSTTERAVERARSGEGPTLIEALTYRHLGHSRSDPATYRPADEVECWLARDPLIVFRECVLRLDLVSETELDDAYAAAKQSVDDATERALAWPAPSLDSRFRDVYA